MNSLHIAAYVPVGRYLIFPTLLLGKNLFETESIAKSNGLVVIPSHIIHQIARHVVSPSPTKEFMRYVRDRNPELTAVDARQAHKEFRTQIWEEQRLIRAKEIVVHARRPFPNHTIINSDTLPYRGDTISYVLTHYNVNPLENGDYEFDINGINPDPRIEYHTESGLARVLGAINRPRRFVWDSNRLDQYGMRSVLWEFEQHGSVLHIDIPPGDGKPYAGSFLGREIGQRG